jgi:hypothetical protein
MRLRRLADAGERHADVSSTAQARASRLRRRRRRRRTGELASAA